MASVGPVAAKLRAFVRERVKPGSRRYRWGNASRLAKHLEVDPGWVTDYVDDPPTNHADIDTALAICDFYGVSLRDFVKSGHVEPAIDPEIALALRDGETALQLLAFSRLSADFRAWVIESAQDLKPFQRQVTRGREFEPSRSATTRTKRRPKKRPQPPTYKEPS